MLWQQAREWVRADISAEHQAGFARAIAYDNWHRSTIMAVVLAGLNLVFGLLPEIYYYRHGYWSFTTRYLALTGLHVGMVLYGLGLFAVLRRMRPVDAAGAGPRHQQMAILFWAGAIALVTAFSVVEQYITGSITAYLLGIAAFATIFYTNARLCGLVLLAAYLGLLGGMFWLRPDPASNWHNVVVGLDAMVVFWVCSRLVFALRRANYVQFATIAQQARALESANRELAHAHQFKTELLALAAHDLRDPLNTIALSAQTLRTNLPPQAPPQTLVTGIAESSRHMADLIDNLIVDADSATRQIVLERQATDLPRLVATTVNAYRATADPKAIVLHYAADDSELRAPPALVDPTRFRQILGNLVSNAVKYSPPGKNVWVTLAHDPAEGHRLVVRDEGPGLTAEDQAHLFGKYRRLSARPTGGETATGLGLAIVSKLVALHGGRVWAESAGPGRGASFVVCVP
jgi:signal transduction histidine kinase